jgi:hypothetical protein
MREGAEGAKAAAQHLAPIMRPPGLIGCAIHTPSQGSDKPTARRVHYPLPDSCIPLTSDGLTRTFLLRLGASLLVVFALGGLGPSWLPTVALAIVVMLSPSILTPAVDAISGGLPGLRRLLQRRWFEISLAAIVAGGIAIRLAGIGLGLWHEPIDVDERRLGESVLGFFRSGALEHGTSEDHPGLQFWWLTGGGLLAYLYGLMSGMLHGIDDAPVELFVGAGRIANVGLAAMTAIFTALIGRALAGPVVGLLAAGVLVVSPLSIETSTQLRNDVGMACAVVACVYAALAMCDRPTRSFAWVAGGLAGCAAGIKITGVFVVVPPMLAAAWVPGSRRPVQAMTVVLAAFAGALAVSNHFIWSDFSNFVRQVAMDFGHVQKGHFAYAPAPRAGYLSLLTSYGVGWPLTVCAGGFLAYALATGRRREWIVLAFPVLYLWFMTLKAALFTRWAYVLVPFVAVAGSAGLVAGARVLASMAGRLRPQPRASAAGRWLGAAVCVAVLLPLAVMSSVAVSRRFTRPTYVIAESWLAGIAAKGDRVVAEVGVLDLSHSGLDVVRVDNLREALQRNGADVRNARWIVVQEQQFGIPELSNLLQVKQFVASMAFGGNAGLDVRVYVPQPALLQPQ